MKGALVLMLAQLITLDAVKMYNTNSEGKLYSSADGADPVTGCDDKKCQEKAAKKGSWDFCMKDKHSYCRDCPQCNPDARVAGCDEKKCQEKAVKKGSWD